MRQLSRRGGPCLGPPRRRPADARPLGGCTFPLRRRDRRLTSGGERAGSLVTWPIRRQVDRGALRPTTTATRASLNAPRPRDRDVAARCAVILATVENLTPKQHVPVPLEESPAPAARGRRRRRRVSSSQPEGSATHSGSPGNTSNPAASAARRSRSSRVKKAIPARCLECTAPSSGATHRGSSRARPAAVDLPASTPPDPR